MSSMYQFLVLFGMIWFLCSSLVSALLFVLGLDKKTFRGSRKIDVLFYNYWSKENIKNFCEPAWRPYLYFFRASTIAALSMTFVFYFIGFFLSL